jgi:hypothetical protein
MTFITPLTKNKKRFAIIISSVLGFMIILSFVFLFIISGRYHERVFTSANGWGYEIVLRNKVIIHQEFIPGISGQIPFSSKEDAKMVARLVIRKLKENNDLPTVKKSELELLGIKIDKTK